MKKPHTNGQDIEALALRAKLKRQTDCSDAINKVLKDHNCELMMLVQVGEVAKPLNEVLGLPMILNVVAKEVAI